MSEEVKIVVKQESQGNALRDTERQLQDLDRAARAYEQKGMTGAARSARTEASQLQRGALARAGTDAAAMRAGGNTTGAAALEREADIMRRAGTFQRGTTIDRAEAVKMASEQVGHEEKIHQAKQGQAAAALEEKAAAKQQRTDAVAHAKEEREAKREAARLTAQAKLEERAPSRGQGGYGSALQHGLSMGGSGGSAAGSALGMLAGAGGPLGIAIAAAAAVAGKMISTAIDKADAEAASEGRGVQSANRHRASMAKEGVAGEEATNQDRLENKNALAEALDKRGSFKPKGVGDRIWGALGMETSDKKASRENELEIARLKKEQPGLKEDAYQKFLAGTGGQALEKQRQLARGHLGEARAIQYKIDRAQEYDRLYKLTGNKDAANEGADMKVAAEKREAAGNYAKLIDARSGAGDIARAATMARQERTGKSSDFDNLIDSVNRNHREALSANRFKNFSTL